MCLILFAYKTHPDYKLILAANRDEFYNRPTTRVHWWEDAPQMLAGKDLKAGGSWLGLSKRGKFAALTNYRDPKTLIENAPTRGKLVTDYLLNGDHPEDYLQKLAVDSSLYNGYNLLAGDPDQLFYYSNMENKIKELSPGIYGLSNHLLDTPWPKVVKGKNSIQQLTTPELISPDALLDALLDADKAPDERLPSTGVSLELERVLSSMFIKSPVYGTRSSSLILINQDNKIELHERAFYPEGEPRKFEFHTT